MGDLKSKKLIILKGILFLGIGLLSGGYILVISPDIRVLALLGVCIWAFCRFYYFLFYVLEKYVGIEGKYAGIGDLVRRLIRKKREDNCDSDPVNDH